MLNIKLFKMLLFFLILSVFITNLKAQHIKSKIEQNKYSAIVEADGYSYLSEDKTIRQIREESLSNAKREALEKGQTYISSFSKVENFQLTYDLIQSEAEGFVKIIESKDYGITPDNRYHYWIKAEIEYILKLPVKKETEKAFLNPNAPLSVSVWTEKSTYKQGEKIKIFIQGNKDFYARVIYIDAKDNILQLIPNQHRTDNYFQGGKVFSIPETFDGFELEVAAPFGNEKIIVYASSSPQGDIETAAAGKSLLKIKSDLKTTGMRTRGVIIKEKPGSSGAEFFETSCDLQTTSH